MGLKIAFIDDHKMLIDLLAETVLKSKGIAEVAKYYNGYDFLEDYKSKNFDLAVVDLRMPKMSGLELVEAIRKENRELKIVIMSGVEGDGAQKELEKRGIDGLVTKYQHIDVIINVINTVGSGEKCFVEDYYEDGSPDLTERELEIIRMMAKEFNSKEIGESLFVSENTVKTHRKNIMKKLKAKNVATVIGYAYKNHLV